MKIGIDCRDLRSDSLGGIGRFVNNFVRSVSLLAAPPKLVLYGNQHTSFDLPDTWGAPPDVITRRKREAATWWFDRITLPKLVRRDRLDVFLSPYFKAPDVRSCPVAVTIHDLLFLRMPPDISGKSAIYCRAFRSFASASARRAAVILTVSEYSRRDIIQLLNVPGDKVVVVGNCVGPNFMPVDAPARIADVKSKYGIQRDYVLYVGNFGVHKNVTGLVEAYARLEPQLRTKVSLVLAGGADKLTHRMRECIDRMHLNGSVHLTGYVNDRDLPELYSGATAFASLSRWEGFGLPVLEAMACGTPTVCSNLTSLPEIAGNAALLVDPDNLDECVDGLRRVLTDDALRARLRKDGLERSKLFTPDKFARLIMNALSRTVPQ